METITITSIEVKPRSYEWHNKVSDIDRKMMAVLYLEGFAVYNLSKALHFSTSTIEWHLKQMGVYKTKRRAVLWNKPITLERKERLNRLASPSSTMKALPRHIQAIYRKMEREDVQSHTHTRPVNHYARHPHLAVTVKEIDTMKENMQWTTFDLTV